MDSHQLSLTCALCLHDRAGRCAEELDVGTAPLSALEALSITNSNLETLPCIDCLSRLTALDLSGAWFEVRILHRIASITVMHPVGCQRVCRTSFGQAVARRFASHQ
jgi:hypothetical protein